MLDEIELNIMRYCNLFDPVTIGRMTLKEYGNRMKAVALQRADREYELHLLAWKIQEVKATRKQGKTQVPVYKKFTSFYDYEKRVDKILGRSKKIAESELSRMRRFAQANKSNREGD